MRMRTRRRYRGGVRSPFAAEFKSAMPILAAETPDNLAVAVIAEHYNNMENINSVIPAPNLSEIITDPTVIQSLTVIQRFKIADNAHQISNGYAGLDIVGIQGGTEAERAQDPAIAAIRNRVHDPLLPLPVEDFYELSKDDIFNPALVNMVANRIAKPDNKTVFFNLEPVISHTLLELAARLRIEVLANSVLNGDLPIVASNARIKAMQQLLDEKKRQKLMENLVAEDTPAAAAQAKKPSKSQKKKAAAAAAAVAVPEVAADVGPTSEANYLIMRLRTPTLKSGKYNHIVMSMQAFVNKIQKQKLLQLRRQILPRRLRIATDIIEARQRLNTSYGNRRRQDYFNSLIAELRPIRNEISLQEIYQISLRNCPAQANPIGNCSEAQATQNSRMNSLLRAKYAMFVAEAKRELERNAAQLAASGKEERYVLNPKGGILRKLVPKGSPKLPNEVEFREAPKETRIKVMADRMMEEWRSQGR